MLSGHYGGSTLTPCPNINKHNLEEVLYRKKYSIWSRIAVQDADGHILLIRAPASAKINPKSWLLPGWRLEIGDSLKTCALRELHEACGLDF